MPRVKALIRRLFTSVEPEMATAIIAARARARSHRLIREWGLLEVNRKLVKHFGPVVQAGRFKGLILSPMTHREHLSPSLLGTYEAELHAWLEVITEGRFSQILDVGAKFGYYAVGLSRRLLGIPVTSFDTDWWVRAAVCEMAVADRIPDVSPAGFRSPGWLDPNLRPNSFLLTDCEGYEGELFSRASTSALDSATLLIGIHDGLVPGVGSAVRKRFEQTHQIEVVNSGQRDHPGVVLSFHSSNEAAQSLREIREPQYWFLARPRAQ